MAGILLNYWRTKSPMDFKGQHILSTRQFDRDSLLSLFGKAKEMEAILDAAKQGKQDRTMEGKLMASIFFEPSTRTRFSFETAMQRLGGRVISNADMMGTSSWKKHESLEDTGKVVSQMADVIVMRHPEKGSVKRLAAASDVPVFNAGDGPAEHPTQAFLDIYTIWKNKGTLDGLTIGMTGDSKYGRVPHSQCDLLKHFKTKFIMVSPDALRMPEAIIATLQDTGHEIVETEDLEGNIGEMDVIACTRIQEERFASEAEYKKYAGIYILNKKLMEKAKQDAIVLHPLPRVDEIAAEVDSDPRMKYFEQVRNGVAVRMALLTMVLGVE